MKTILLIGYLGAGNFGDECMLREFINLFQDSDRCHFRIFSLGTNYDSENVTTYYCSKTPLRIKKEYIRALSGVDAVVWVGGNCFTDHDNNGGFFHILLAKLLGKKFYYCGVGIDDLGKFTRIVKSYIAMHLADGLIMRDHFSLEKTRSWLSNNGVFWYGMDLGELYLMAQRSNYVCTKEYIAVSWRELAKNIGSLSQMNIVTHLADYIYELSQKTDKPVVIFNSDPLMDRAVNIQLVTALKSKGIKNLRYEAETTLERKLKILSAAYCIITARLHTAVAGYVFDKPIMLFNYSQKIVEFAQDKPSVLMLSETMSELGKFQEYLNVSVCRAVHNVISRSNYEPYYRLVNLLKHPSA